ncbi:uncharacterized protein VNE69_06223 [Vairimorpha necatrix]|uniref:Uncharacterized protein n=1 Tax=Vairimorpha necatrix TaxID=6039 RepID=A0AAX4JD67_9MICR
MKKKEYDELITEIPAIERLYKSLICEDQIKKYSIKNIEPSSFNDNCDSSIFLTNDIDIFMGHTKKVVFKNKDLNTCDFGDWGKSFNLDSLKKEKNDHFDMMIDQSQEINILTNKNSMIDKWKLLRICNNKLKTYIERRKSKLNTDFEYFSKNTYDNVQDKLIKNYNMILFYFRDGVFNRLNKFELTRLSNLIMSMDVSTNLKRIIIEIIHILKYFMIIYDERESKRHFKIRNAINIVKVIHYNIEIMYIFNYMPIIETLNIIEADLMLEEFVNDTIRNKVRKNFESIITDIQKILFASNKIIKIYIKNIEIFKKK